jgi:VIT1/CCC1 family predicted Fe2+/Mn2+ transporter
VAGGLVPLLPVVVLRSDPAVAGGTVLSFVALFVLGAAKGKALHLPWVRSGLEILVVAGAACVAGIAAGVAVGT